MTKQRKYPDVWVKLTGEDGNALHLVALVSRALQDAGAPEAERCAFEDEALNGDYNQVLRTCMAWMDVG